ncbi:MAG: hypothetical protein ACUVQG_00200 [Thermogutta sp.]
MNAKTKLSLLALVVGVVLVDRANGQCLLSRLFNRETTYTTQYGGYNLGYAYMPVAASPVAVPVSATRSYRVAYLPVTPGATTVYRPAPVMYQPPVVTTSYLPVVAPYATPPAVSSTTVPVVTYRPVQIVYEPRRLFNWRPFANLRARQTGYWPAPSATWSTAYFATYQSVPVVSDSTVCGWAGPSYATGYPASEISGSTCASCAPSSSSSWQPVPDNSIPTLPPAGSSSTPPTTFKQEGSTTESRFKPADATNRGTNASGTSAPVIETRPLVRQALYEKPIPLIEEASDPPMVDVTGWRRGS